MHEEFGDEGLVVMALSDEMAKDVKPYAKKYDLPFLVGIGSTAKSSYGVRGIPQTFLIDAEGKIAWSGHPLELTSGTIKKALRGTKLPKNRLLAFRGDADGTPAATKLEKLGRDGDIAAALKAADATIADAKASAEDKQAAEAAKVALSAHVDGIAKQAESYVEAREVGRAIELFTALSQEFGSEGVGAAAKKRLDEIAKDPSLQKEIEAAKELAEIKKQMRDIGLSKVKKRLEALVSKYVGTKAAERALALLK